MARITCPMCEFSANLPEGYARPTVQCPKCKAVFELAAIPLRAREPIVEADPSESRNREKQEKAALKRFQAEVRYLDGCKSAGFWLVFLSMVYFALTVLYAAKLFVFDWKGLPNLGAGASFPLRVFGVLAMVATTSLAIYFMIVGTKLRKLDPKTNIAWPIVAAVLTLPVGVYSPAIGCKVAIAVLLHYDLNARYATDPMFDDWTQGGVLGAVLIAFGTVGIIAAVQSIKTSVRIFKKSQSEI